MKKFIIVIISSLIFMFLIWGTTYFYSLTIQYEASSIPFYKDSFEVIAHRGGSLERPENTMEAFNHAASLGPDIILELDVYLTADKELVVFHDNLLDRTTNGTGPIHTKTLAELKELDAAYFFQDAEGTYPYRGQGIQIPTLKEVFEKHPSQRMIVEVKQNSVDPAVATIDLIKKYQRVPITLVGSEYSSIIRYVKSKEPELYTTAGKDEVLRSVMLENIGLERLDSMRSDAYCIPEFHSGIPVLTPRLLQEIQRRGKKTYVWTINDLDKMRELISAGVHGIITDRPTLLLQELQAPSQN